MEEVKYRRFYEGFSRDRVDSTVKIMKEVGDILLEDVIVTEGDDTDLFRCVLLGLRDRMEKELNEIEQAGASKAVQSTSATEAAV